MRDFILDNEEKVKSKLGMLDLLQNMKITDKIAA
jgi:hypothetical protein